MARKNLIPPESENPFEFGRELSADEIVDRQDEIRALLDTIEGAGRLFLIGPRRYGKTSILRAATERARAGGAAVLRYNAEAYPKLTRLAERIVADSASQLIGPLRKAGLKATEAFGSLRPQLTYNPHTDAFSATIAKATAGRTEQAMVAEALDGVNALAKGHGKPVAVVIDEFQRVVESGGEEAEAQIRAAVQTHDHVGYVFAGSKTHLLAAMTGDAERPFYRLGARLFVGPVPRVDFRPFILGGFANAGFPIGAAAADAILDLSEDVPYNVQRLAHACWSEARTASEPLTPERIEEVLEKLVSRDDPFYTQAWNGLSKTQKLALMAVAAEGGTGIFAGEVLRAYEVSSASTMRTAVQALVKAGIARPEEHAGSTRYRLEDPFFASWLRLFVVGP